MISEENIQTLQSMTNDEIKEARKKILSTIGPRALEKLKNIKPKTI
jgi:hypothetical protein